MAAKRQKNEMPSMDTQIKKYNLYGIIEKISTNPNDPSNKGMVIKLDSPLDGEYAETPHQLAFYGTHFDKNVLAAGEYVNIMEFKIGEHVNIIAIELPYGMNRCTLVVLEIVSHSKR